jgi:uncharacterized protein
MRTIEVNAEDDNDYLLLVSDILDNEEFKELVNYVHHDSNRLQHSLNVSYISYKVAKKLKLDYRKVARAALLHDFFLVDNHGISKFDRFLTLFLHPKYALSKAKERFELSKMEENIIISHMFPVGLFLPRYKESVLVNMVDDYVAIVEACVSKQKEISAAYSFLFIFMVNFIFRW